MDFETDVYPVVLNYARQRGLSDELMSIALVLAWWIWSHRTTDAVPSVYARMAVRNALAGRDLPGIRDHFNDVWDKLTLRQGGGMQGVADSAPPPYVQAGWTEFVDIAFGDLTPFKRQVIELRLEGMPNKDIAAQLGVTPGRISQVAREFFERIRKLPD